MGCDRVINYKKEDFKAVMKKEYPRGVDIVFDESSFDDCRINASLSELSLYEKIRAITKATNSNFEVIDTSIIITGAGCQN